MAEEGFRDSLRCERGHRDVVSSVRVFENETGSPRNLLTSKHSLMNYLSCGFVWRSKWHCLFSVSRLLLCHGKGVNAIILRTWFSFKNIYFNAGFRSKSDMYLDGSDLVITNTLMVSGNHPHNVSQSIMSWYNSHVEMGWTGIYPIQHVWSYRKMLDIECRESDLDDFL